jgi:hypothetical protein
MVCELQAMLEDDIAVVVNDVLVELLIGTLKLGELSVELIFGEADVRHPWSASIGVRVILH